MIDSNQTTSFDRMRSMLVRAAEVRDSEQQQIFDSLDEIHGRLAALDALGAMRKRLADVPDRTEMSVLAERLDETVAKLDAQESTVSSLARLVEGLPAAVTGPVRERLESVESSLRGQVEETSRALAETTRSLSEELSGSREAARTDAVALRDQSSEQVRDLTGRLEALTSRLDGMGTRVEGVENSLASRVENVQSAVGAAIDGLDTTLSGKVEGLERGLSGLSARVDGVESSLSDRVSTMAARWRRRWTSWTAPSSTGPTTRPSSLS